MTISFDVCFKRLTGCAPFPWQKKLFKELASGTFRKTCSIPTGLGKTSIIQIWLLALAQHIRSGTIEDFPRRLVYVVNRRTFVDQATREVEDIRRALISEPELEKIARVLQSLQTQGTETPLAISTLRGQFADNGEWRADPARPAVIIGTVDMIGSRLLFSGNGCGFKSRPLHAGFLGQDTLLVHDEAHLEPAFQELLITIALEQQRSGEFRKFQVMELTATSRSDTDCEDPLFSNEDEKHDEVRKRIRSKKGIKFHPVDDEKVIADKITQRAKGYKNSGQAILIFLRTLEQVSKVVESLLKVVPDSVETLTGTLRGRERDTLAKENPVFARFMRSTGVEPREGTVYLVCSSAGEVGVNISADHLICDLTPYDSMAQRFGRVNRFGYGDAHIDVIHTVALTSLPADTISATPAPDGQNEPEDTTTSNKSKSTTPYEVSCIRTLKILHQLPVREDGRHDASPATLSALSDRERQKAFTPAPAILPTTDILFDAWAMTTIHQKLPGRPPLGDWLHGIAQWEPPTTFVAWREEVEYTTDLLSKYLIETLLEVYPLKPHEILRDREDRVRKNLEKIATRHPNKLVWLIDSDGEVTVTLLKEIVAKDKLLNSIVNLANCTVLLPPSAGGLENGLLNGDITAPADDIADLWFDENGEKRRFRTWQKLKPKGMRLAKTVDIGFYEDEDWEETEETDRKQQWRWYVQPSSADDDGSRTAHSKQLFHHHLSKAQDFAEKLVDKLALAKPEASAVVLASQWHDLGKNRRVWQRAIGNQGYPAEILAKSGPGMRSISLNDYRHELGSLLDLQEIAEFCEQPEEIRQLVLHLIAAHHGRARPHFPENERFDHERSDKAVTAIVSETPGRFARLQRRYGRWGLAYLESLVRAADIMASQVSSDGEVEEDNQ